MGLDFSHAQLPWLAPLQHSFAENNVEAQLKALFSDVFKQYLAADVFDANVAGMAHLGSFERLRRSINHDGLVLIQNDGQHAATRYLYRAWQARNRNGRGLHFLRTYLQLLYPNQWAVEPLWQHKDQPYPQQLNPSPEDKTQWWLTSRIRILLYWGARAHAIAKMAGIIQAVIPARLLPEFKYLFNSGRAPIHLGATMVCSNTVSVYPAEREKAPQIP